DALRHTVNVTSARVRKRRVRMRVVAEDRPKRGLSDRSVVDPFVREQTNLRQRAVYVSPPRHAPAHELLGMAAHEPRLPFAIADLLAPVAGNRVAMVMPDQRRRREGDLPALRLQPPAHIHIVAG